MEQKMFTQISPDELGNAMKLIGKDWMLIVARDEQGNKVNGMTASWGFLGVMWNKNVAVCMIRPQRYTYGLVEAADRVSLAFLSEEYRDALRLCGSRSGRDGDKLAEVGLTTEELDGVPVIQEADTVVICRKLYADDLKKDGFLDPSLLAHYKQEDYHRMYVCEIEKVYRKV
ncbi:MAG: flavin reductase family protein [Clostridia bacterium]|nr:flavin reductase family protein [Clostridia bacterium]